MKKYSVDQLRSAWGAGRNAQDLASGIVGKWFHSYDTNGLVMWQGQVISAQPEDHYLVQLFSWLTGLENGSKLVKFSAMAEWTFYNSSEQMQEYYYKYLEPRVNEHIKRQRSEL